MGKTADTGKKVPENVCPRCKHERVPGMEKILRDGRWINVPSGKFTCACSGHAGS